MKQKNLEIGIFKALFHNVPHKGLKEIVYGKTSIQREMLGKKSCSAENLPVE